MKVFTVPRNGICRIAADVFVDLWCKVTDQELPVIHALNEAADDEDLVVIGSDSDNVWIHELLMDGTLQDPCLKESSDEYALISRKVKDRSVLFLLASGPRAPLYAVYDYFERVGGCAYFWDGDRIPKAASLPLEGLHIQERPRFQYRGLRYFAHRSLTRFQAEHWDFEDWKRELDWLMKKRLDFFMLRIGIDDLFQRAFPDIVPYPDRDKQLPEAIARSYDDRNLFWSLEYRGQLRKRIMDYASERGLISPEDCGTMTHWYSRTPKAFLEKIKPDFLPQANGCYTEPTGLVMDITQDKYLDFYWKLTETSIRDWGKPQIFHTIGLAERGCYNEPEKNHAMKMYTYRRILSKVREKYPDAPMLIGTWDFVERWSTQQVQDLVRTFDPENTIIFDYVSDIYDEINNFTNWGVINRFPYFFGIFHAYEACSEIRGNYRVIEQRLPVAAADPMCKGMVLWPENSHADTLMLEYLAANAWDPAPENIRIESFLETFLTKRCGKTEQGGKLAEIWRIMLPLIRTHYWRTRIDERWRDLYPDLIFNPIRRNMLYQQSNSELENCGYLNTEMWPAIKNAVTTFRKLAELDHNSLDSMLYRDTIDLARTAALRIILFATYDIQLELDRWRKQLAEPPAEKIKLLRTMIWLLAETLDAHEDYSLYDSLNRLKQCQPTNPHFEQTLKANAETWYCRSFISELFKGCYLPEYDAIAESLYRKFTENDRSFSGQPAELQKRFEEIQNNFYNTPLADLAPDHIKAKLQLKQTFNAMADTAEALIANQ